MLAPPRSQVKEYVGLYVQQRPELVARFLPQLREMRANLEKCPVFAAHEFVRTCAVTAVTTVTAVTAAHEFVRTCAAATLDPTTGGGGTALRWPLLIPRPLVTAPRCLRAAYALPTRVATTEPSHVPTAQPTLAYDGAGAHPLDPPLLGRSILLVYSNATNTTTCHVIDLTRVSELLGGQTVNHRDEWAPGNHEDGYLVGLDNLIATFEDVHAQLERATQGS